MLIVTASNIKKIAYWISTGIFCLIFLFSAYIHLFKHSQVVNFYENLGFPTWIIYPSGIAKVFGVIAVISKKSKLLKEWAYAGFFFDASLALTAHYVVGDGAGSMALIALITLVSSRIFEPKVYN
jgi:hypothetical protein